MLRNILRVFLIFRLELRQLPLDVDQIVYAWVHRPAIHLLHQVRESTKSIRRTDLARRLDEVYPF